MGSTANAETVNSTRTCPLRQTWTRGGPPWAPVPRRAPAMATALASLVFTSTAAILWSSAGACHMEGLLTQPNAA